MKASHKYDSSTPVQGHPSKHADVDVPVSGFEDFAHQEYQALVIFLTHRTATLQDAEDAAQESMARMLRYRTSTPTSAWEQLLYRIAVNVAHDQYRTAVSHQSTRHVSLEEQSLAAPGLSPEEQAAYEQQLSCLRDAIAQLPPKCQRVYMLKRIHGMSHAEVKHPPGRVGPGGFTQSLSQNRT